jgi:cytoskeletal protein CcmA (bactofilin family)
MTHIGPEVFIDGELRSEQSLRVDGHVRGLIVVRNAELTVGHNGRVEADVRSARVLVLGTVEGNITASDRIELGSTAKVTGGLSANKVVIADGARFTGRVDMDRRTIAAKVAQFKESQAAAAAAAR